MVMRVLKDGELFIVGLAPLALAAVIFWYAPPEEALSGGEILGIALMICTLITFGVIGVLESLNLTYIRKRLKDLKTFLFLKTVYSVKTRPMMRKPEGNMSEEVECPYCFGEFPESILDITDKGNERTASCPSCSLKIWLEGDGWKKYRKVNDLTPGCMDDGNPDPMQADGGGVDVDDVAWNNSTFEVEEVEFDTTSTTPGTHEHRITPGSSGDYEIEPGEIIFESEDMYVDVSSDDEDDDE